MANWGTSFLFSENFLWIFEIQKSQNEVSVTVRKRKNEALHLHCVQQTMKSRGGKLLVSSCLFTLGARSLVRVKSIMDKNVY